MTAGFRLQEPVVYGNRTIIPVVRETAVCHDHGMVASLLPVALLIGGEDGKWGIALLEGDSVTGLLERIALPS